MGTARLPFNAFQRAGHGGDFTPLGAAGLAGHAGHGGAGPV